MGAKWNNVWEVLLSYNDDIKVRNCYVHCRDLHGSLETLEKEKVGEERWRLNFLRKHSSASADTHVPEILLLPPASVFRGC